MKKERISITVLCVLVIVQLLLLDSAYRSLAISRQENNVMAASLGQHAQEQYQQSLSK